MPYRYDHVDTVIGAILGSIDAGTHSSPLYNLVSSAFIGAAGGAVHTAFSPEKRWGSNIGSSLLTTTAASALTYYLVRGMMGARYPHHHRQQPAPVSTQDCASCVTSWQEHVLRPSDPDTSLGR